jgi:membrane-bound lytic murein transglycosylase C
MLKASHLVKSKIPPAVLLVAAICLLTFAVFARQTFLEYLQQQQKEYEEFQQREAEDFAAYVAEVEKKWKEFKNSTQRDWYEYSRDLNTISHVDFEEGRITIETLVEKSDEDILARARKNITEKVEGLFKTDSLANEVILAGQVEFNSQPPVDSANAAEFVDEKIMPDARIEKTTIVGDDGVERIKVTAAFKMVPDHLSIRAKKYLPLVRKYCRRFELEIPLVLAVIQTESYFNPRAKSPAPAYGLMQLVPTSGAREGYMYSHREDKIVKPNFLYIPENNVLLGCAYLAKMRDNEFKEITDRDKLRYCLVASYNTGPGNLSRAVIGSPMLNFAVEKINGMTDKQLFDKLKSDLPYEETRDYIVKVENRRENYREWQ